MKSLEQIRARNALTFANSGTIRGENDGEVIKKIPPLVMNNGLLAAAAFSCANKGGWSAVFDAITVHLSDPEIKIIPTGYRTRDQLIRCLNEGDSDLLKRATAETMAWLNYARRFVKKGGKETFGHDN